MSFIGTDDHDARNILVTCMFRDAASYRSMYVGIVILLFALVRKKFVVGKSRTIANIVWIIT